MTVGIFVQPNHETQSGAIYKAAIDNSLAVLKRIGAMFAPHEQDTPDMTVRVDAGVLFANAILSDIAAQNTGTITAPTGTDHRIDRVVIDAVSGAVSLITGTPGASPAVPAITTGKLPVCQVALAHDMTVITNDLIIDERVMGGGGGEAFPINSIYQNFGEDPATELGYGTWVNISNNINPFYPLAQNDTYVKATGFYTSNYYPHFATDPALLLLGTSVGNQWMDNQYSNRFHIDLGSAIIINQIYYENGHSSGYESSYGVKNFTLLGSNTPSAFTELTYAIDTDWTQLTTSQTTFDQHVAANTPDPKYIAVTGITPYRYYAFKFADTWAGDYEYMTVRRIVLQLSNKIWLRVA